LTLDRALLSTVIKNLTARGETSLYDAVVFAQTLFSGSTSDKQLVLLSDGGDTVSKSDLAQATAVAAAIKTNVIELTSSEANHSALEQLSSANNGTIGSATDPAALQGLYKRVANGIVNRYRVSFQSKAHGSVTYTLTVETSAGPAEVNIKGNLPALVPVVVPPTTTTTVAPTPTTTTVVAAAAEAPSDTVPVAVAPSSGSSSSSGQTLRLLLGTTAEFLGLSVLTLLAVPFTRDKSVPRNRLGVAQKENAPRAVSLRIRLSRAAERMLERRGRRRGLAEALEVAGISLRPGEFFVLAIGAGAVLALVFFALFGILGMVIGTIAAPLLARAYVSSKATTRRRKFGEQLPDLMQSMVSSLRGGYGLPQAIDSAANQAAEPARTELQRVLLEGRIGRDPTEALQAVADRMQSRDFNWVVAAIDINRDIGGELALVLENVAETVRERQRLSRQVRTLTAEGRLSAYVLTALPILLALFIKLSNPDYFDPLSKSPGPALVVIAGVLMVVGWVWMRKLIKSQM
jgi:tight adherence protein B